MKVSRSVIQLVVIQRRFRKSFIHCFHERAAVRWPRVASKSEKSKSKVDLANVQVESQKGHFQVLMRAFIALRQNL